MKNSIALLTLALCACTKSAHTTATSSAPAALTSAECGQAYDRWHSDIPPCVQTGKCSVQEQLGQMTPVTEHQRGRRDRSCSVLHSRSWYDCAMQATTSQTWFACLEQSLAPQFQPLRGEGPFVLGIGSSYVARPDLLKLKAIAGERATVLVTDTLTGEQYESVLGMGDKLDLSREYPADPEIPLPGMDETQPAPRTWKRQGDRFTVAAITNEQIVLEPVADNP